MADDSKTEKASPKKRRDERKKGNVFKSQDLVTIVTLVGSFYALKFLFPLIYETTRTFLVRCIDYVNQISSLSNEVVIELQNEMILDIAMTAVPLLMVTAVLAILATGIQTRFLIVFKNLAPKFNRISPLSGIKKLFSMKNVVELLKNLLKITLLIVVIIMFMKDRSGEIVGTMSMSLENSALYVLNNVIRLVESVIIWFVLIGGFDLFYQWWDYERQIKMSKQEVKEEYKQMEGNPEVKAKIREIQRQRARSRMMQAVPTADVIIRNPTHFAVALKYNPEEHTAPIVVAKGQDEVALRIIKMGEEHDVCVISDPPLTRAIYAATDLNKEVPSEYYGVIAEILVYVYKLNNKSLT